MSKARANSEATYARHLIRLLLAEQDPAEKTDIANTLVACVTQIAHEVGAPEYDWED
jgi:hypothetical protein